MKLLYQILFSLCAVFSSSALAVDFQILRLGDASDSGTIAGYDRVLFSRETQESGNEFWVSDGTLSGTHLLRDFSPGPNSTVVPGNTEFDRFFNNFNMWTIAAPSYKTYVSDGTTSGTKPLSDLGFTQADAIFLNQSPALGNKRLFDSNSPLGDIAISDGTSSGTTYVRVRAYYANTKKRYLANNRILFLGSNADQQLQLWSSAGTTATTQALMDINDPEGEPLSDAVIVGNKLFDVITVAPWKLYYSDGTTTGTGMTSIPVNAWPGYPPGAGFTHFYEHQLDCTRNYLWMLLKSVDSNSDDGVTIYHNYLLRYRPDTSALEFITSDTGRMQIMANLTTNRLYLRRGNEIDILNETTTHITQIGKQGYLLAPLGTKMIMGGMQPDQTLNHELWAIGTSNNSQVKLIDLPHLWSINTRITKFYGQFILQSGNDLVHSDGTPTGTALYNFPFFNNAGNEFVYAPVTTFDCLFIFAREGSGIHPSMWSIRATQRNQSGPQWIEYANRSAASRETATSAPPDF